VAAPPVHAVDTGLQRIESELALKQWCESVLTSGVSPPVFYVLPCTCVRAAVGILTVAIVTYPFSFEGRRRANQAMKGITALKECVDCLIIIPNDKLLDVTDRTTSLNDAFRKADDVLRQGVQVSQAQLPSGLGGCLQRQGWAAGKHARFRAACN